ncbi:MAG: primosomal protein N', partial [Ruminococcaceae bacterium]|nr:primosomal protein N' [Oscillospiraceae bacterium]
MSCGVKVAVENAAFKFDKLYSYAVPDALAKFAKVGARVLVPFGKSRPRMGVVLETEEENPVGLKSVIDIEKSEPLLDSEQVSLILFLHETTFCTYFDAVKTVLPKNARLVANEEREGIVNETSAHLETVFVYRPEGAPPRLTEKQKAVCELIENTPLTAAEITEKLSVGRDVINRLAEKGIISRENRNKDVEIYEMYSETGEIPRLTPAQERAFEEIVEGCESPALPDTALLNGVTSSGKTLIYIKLIERALAAGKSTLLLLPEIAIATQMIYRLKTLFGEKVGILHSALSDTERYLQWTKIKSGDYRVIIGTRTAVFSPARDLGLIIVDEEQEGSFRSEKNPRYDAVSVARFRAKKTGAKLLLASATPSVESYYMASSGRYSLVNLDERYGDMPLPTVTVTDMRSELLAGNSHHISQYLNDEIQKRLDKGEQCILLLNRRGYRTVSICRSCKKIVKCESCDTPLVLHKSTGTHICHYCGRSYPIREICDDCGGAITHTGIGTQKIEEELEGLFPNARILRMDVDSVSKKHSMEKLLYDFSRGEYDIIIGTQMIAKGLDFKNVTLVGVLSIDQLML